MERIKRSWRLFKASFGALACHKKLLVFPALTALGAIVMALFFFGSVALCIAETTGFDSTGKTETQIKCGAAVAAVTVAVYLAAMVASTFLNVAFYGETLRALSGDEVSLRRGLRLALSKIMPIVAWSLFAGIVGYIIKTLEDNLRFLGKIAMSFIGLAWSVASVFVIPAIAMDSEGVINPLSHIRRSASTITKTWGESLAGYAGFSILSGIGALLVIGIVLLGGATMAVCGVFQTWPDSIALLLAAAALLAMALIGFTLACGVAERIYLCALYKYAVEGAIPEHFTQEDLDSAWKTKKQ